MYLSQTLKGEITKDEEEIETLNARQQELKTALYAKFGDRINLDA